MPLSESYISRFKGLSENRQQQILQSANQADRRQLSTALQDTGDAPWYAKAAQWTMDAPVLGNVAEPVMDAGMWWHEHVSEPLAAGAWSLGVQMQPGMQQGEKRLKDAGFWDWEKRVEGYREWESPWGAKFLMEVGLDPTTYITGAGVLGAGAKLAGKGGMAAKAGAPLMKAGKALSKAESAVLAPVTKPLGYVGKKASAKVGATKIYRQTIEGTDTELAIAVPATGSEIASDLMKRAGNRVLGRYGRNTPDALQPVELAYHTHLQIQDMARTQPEVFVSQLRKQADDMFGEHEFGKIFHTDANGRIGTPEIIPKKADESMAWGDIFQSPRKYRWGGMEFDEAVKAGNKHALYRNTYTSMQDMMVRMLKDNGIVMKKLFLDEGEDYIGRVVLGRKGRIMKPTGVKGHVKGEKALQDEMFEMNTLKSKTLGTKTAGEKVRQYKTMDEGIHDGFVYASPEEALSVRLAQTYNRLAQQEALRVLLPFSRTMRERFPKEVEEEAIRLQKAVKQAEKEYKAVQTAANEPQRRIGKELYDELPEDVQATITRIQEGAPTNVGDAPQMKMLSKAERDAMVEKSNIKLIHAKDEFKRYKETTVRDARNKAKAGPRVHLPALQGRIIDDVYDEAGNRIMRGEDLAKAIEDKFAPQGIDKTLTTIKNTSRFFVTAEAAMDFSWAMIQGWGALAHDMAMWAFGKKSSSWAQGLKGTIDGFNSVENVTKNLAENADFLMRHKHLMADAPDLYGAISAVEGAWSKVPVIGKAVSKAYKKTGRAFTHAGVRARIDIAKGLEQSYAKDLGVAVKDLPEATIREIDEMANKLTGTISTEALGISAKQRAIESATLFAPRFLRANLMLLRDFARGGMTGKVARTRLSMLMGGMIGSYSGICAAMGQKPYLDPRPSSLGGDGGKFLSFDVADIHVGYPGFWNSMLRVSAGVAGAADEDPESLISFDLRNNPALAWLAGKSSPVVGAGREIIEGRDFLGNRIDDPEDWAAAAAQKITPIMLQGLLQTNQEGDAKMLFGEAVGMRVWGTSEWDKRNSLRDRYADTTYGLEWDELNQGQKEDIERNHQDLQDMTEKINKEWAMQRGSDFEKAYYMVTSEVDTNFNNQMEGLASRLQRGIITWDKYNEERSKLTARRASAKDVAYSMKGILDKKSIESIERWVEENQKPEDKAMDEYKAIFGEPVMGLFGEVDWDATYKKADNFLKGQTPEIREYIKRYEDSWILDLPPAARDAEQQRKQMIERLRPYWEVKGKIIGAYPKATQDAIEQFRRLYMQGGREVADRYLMTHPQLATTIEQINEKVSIRRNNMRLRDPMLNNAVELWYRRPRI